MKRRASIPIHSDGRLMRTSAWDTAISILGRRKGSKGDLAGAAASALKAAVEQAEGLGAKVLIPPTLLPEGDEKAVKHDPAGMIFAVWRRP